MDRVLRETGEIVENGLPEIYVNATTKDGSEVPELMRISVNLKAYNDKLFPVISGVKKYYKENKHGMQDMYELTEEVFAKGKAKRTLFTMRNMMKSLNLTTNKTLDVCEIKVILRPFL